MKNEQKTKYAVSDRNGIYVMYTNNRNEALEYIDELNAIYSTYSIYSDDDLDLNGRAALMVFKADLGHYELD